MSWIGMNLQKYQKMKQIPKNINWDATAFFERLASCDKLAKTEGCTSAAYRDLKALRSASTAFSPLPTLSLSVTSPKVTRSSTPHRTLEE